MRASALHNPDLKQIVADNFGQKARDYIQYAKVQRKAAEYLVSMVDDILPKLDGPYLELGAGTGFVTQLLMDKLPAGDFAVTDISEEMLAISQEVLNVPDAINAGFLIKDAEAPLPESTYGLIATAMTAQWFENLDATFHGYLNALKPNGLFVYSYLDERCFPEWKALCAESGIPFTGNTLPTSAPLSIDTSKFCWEYASNEIMSETYESPAEFFRNLKRIGAGTQRNGNKNSVGAVLALNEHWLRKGHKQFKISYGISFGAIRRKRCE
ncbi:MAG TPA: hypothetical protein DCE78_11300 [Bacteroidetes bacterium]|nr:hypothetical protein [Bacteroidota bacterium]